MRRPFSARAERGRVTSDGHGYESAPGDDYGFFRVATNAGALLGIMVSPGSDEIPWEHVSVSLRHRCPTWDEMCWVKSLFFDEEEAVVQFHPPRSEYVNQHAFCLHLWKPWKAIELPPSIAVGVKGAPMLVGATP